jgi:hypothetical protein
MRRHTSRHPWLATLVGVAALLALAAGTARAATYTWNSTAAGNWSDTAKWTPSGYPVTAGDTAVFSQNLGANTTITLDVAGVTIGSLTLEDTAAGNGWVIAGGNTLTLAGPATIHAAGSNVIPYNLNPHTISVPLVAAVPVQVNIGANGGLVLKGNNAGMTGGLTITGGGHAGYVRFDTAASLGGPGAGITVMAGNLALLNYNGLNAADLGRFSQSAGVLSFYFDIVNHSGDPWNAAPFSPAANIDLTGFNPYFRLGAAAIPMTGASSTISGTFTPAGDTFRFGGGGGSLVVAAALADGADPRGLEVYGREVVRTSTPSFVALTAANPYAGVTEVRNGVLRLAGTNGAALNTAAINVRNGAFLQMDAGLKVFGWSNESGSVVGNSNNRIGDATPVNLYGGTLNFFGNPDTGTTETIGPLTAQTGLARLDVRWKTGIVTYDTGGSVYQDRGGAGTGAAVLTAQSLSLDNGAHLWLRGANVGAAGTSATRVMLNSAPTTVGGGGAGGSTAISILPGVFYTTGIATSQNSGTNHWVMYDAGTGLRGLVAGEYSALGSGENSDNNTVYQQAGAGATLTLAATTVNSVKFQFEPTSGNMTVAGTGPLTLKSGNLLVEGNPSGDGRTFYLNVPLDFNGRQGNVVYMTDTFTGYQLNSVMSNTGGNGVAFSAFNTAIYMPEVPIRGANVYTGPTTFNAGYWRTENGSNRLPAGSDLRVRGGARLTVTTTENVGSLAGAGSLVLSGGSVVVGTGTALGNTLVVGGPVSPGDSAGTLALTGNLSANASAVFHFELGPPEFVGSGINDLIAVSGNLTLDGTLNITPLAGFGPAPGQGWGTYTLFTYTGTLTDNGLDIGSAPIGYGYVLSAAGGAVTLLVPEPVSAVLLALAALALPARRRRR